MTQQKKESIFSGIKKRLLLAVLGIILFAIINFVYKNFIRQNLENYEFKISGIVVERNSDSNYLCYSKRPFKHFTVKTNGLEGLLEYRILINGESFSVNSYNFNKDQFLKMFPIPPFNNWNEGENQIEIRVCPNSESMKNSWDNKLGFKDIPNCKNVVYNFTFLSSECTDMVLVCNDDNLNSFYIHKNEMTKKQFISLMGFENDSQSDIIGVANSDMPVTEVTWFAAKECCEKIGGNLPTKKQWEKAFLNANRRGKLNIPFDCPFDSIVQHSRINYSSETKIYNLQCNVGEWCIDWYDKVSKSKHVVGYGSIATRYMPSESIGKKILINKTEKSYPQIGFRCVFTNDLANLCK